MEDDLDDLFGDGAPLQITTPPTPALIAHLNQCSTTGCCQQIAWSKSGIIASLTNDKQGVILQHLACDPQSGQWRLSKAYQLEDVSAVHGGVELIHLAWDQFNNLLAICDVQGRISIYLLPNVNFAVNRLTAWKRCVMDPKDDMSAIVGLAWLPPQKTPGLFACPAVRKDGQFSYTVKPQPIPGPKILPGKPALIAVTRNGRVKLLYFEKERWLETRIELPSFGKSNAVLTHAALCPDPTAGSESMLLVSHNSIQELHMYRIKVDTAQATLMSQSLVVHRGRNPRPQQSDVGTDSSFKHDILIYLDFIPCSLDAKHLTFPKVLAVFTNISHDYQGHDTVETTVRCWDIIPDTTNLHPALSQLGSKKSGQNLPIQNSPLRLTQLTEIVVSKALLAVYHISFNNTLAFTWNDGVVEFRDVQSLSILAPDVADQISGLVTRGFAFPGQGSYLHSALSSSATAVVHMDENGGLDVAFLQFVGTMGATNAIDDATLALVSEAFAIQLSLTIRAMNADDLLGTIQSFSQRYILPLQLSFVPDLMSSINFSRTLIAGFLRHLTIENLLVENPEAFMMNLAFRPCLAFQVTLSFQGQYSLRSTEAMVSMILLNVRYVFSAITMAMKNQNGESELKRPDAPHFLLPLVDWFLSLVCHLTDELLMTRNEFEQSAKSPEHVDANVINQQIQQAQSTVLPLLFGSASRVLIRHTCRSMRSFQFECDKLRTTANLGPIFRDFEVRNRRFPVTIPQFERICEQIDASVKAAYQAPGIGDAEKKAAELQIFVRGEIPPILVPAVSQLLFQNLSVLKEEVNEANLYFLDFSNLALTNDAYTRKKNQEHPIDVITKQRLKKESTIKRCTRCCSLTEELSPTKIPTTKSRVARTCVCGSHWVQLDPEDRTLFQV